MGRPWLAVALDWTGVGPPGSGGGGRCWVLLDTRGCRLSVSKVRRGGRTGSAGDSALGRHRRAVLSCVWRGHRGPRPSSGHRGPRPSTSPTSPAPLRLDNTHPAPALLTHVSTSDCSVAVGGPSTADQEMLRRGPEPTVEADLAGSGLRHAGMAAVKCLRSYCHAISPSVRVSSGAPRSFRVRSRLARMSGIAVVYRLQEVELIAGFVHRVIACAR